MRRRSQRTALFGRLGLSLVLALALVACRSTADLRGSDPPSTPTTGQRKPAAIAAATPTPSNLQGDAGVGAVAAPAPSREDRGWNSFPPSDAKLSYVVDGYCTLADVSFVGDTTLLKYGEHSEATVARVTKDGALVDVERLSRNDPGAFKYGRPFGVAPDSLFWPVNMGGRAFDLPMIARYSEEKGWQTPKQEDPPHEFLALYGKGALAVKRRCENGDSCSAVGIVAIGEPTPPLASDGFNPSALRVLPDKSIVAIGEVCSDSGKNCAAEARHFSEDRGRKVFRLGTDLGPASIAARSRDDVLAVFAGTSFRFDGAKWSRVSSPMKTNDSRLSVLDVAPDGAFWAAHGGKVFRLKPDATGWEDISPPASAGQQRTFPEYVPQVDGITAGNVWAIRGNALYRTATADVRWEPVPVPKPPFSSRNSPPSLFGVRVKNTDEAWVNVTYTENYGDASRYEQRRALLRSGSTLETMRCRTRENMTTETRRGFESWPPRADATCKTPAVILGRGKLDKDGFPRSRALLKGRRELGIVEVVEVPSEVGMPYVVARIASLESAKKLTTSLLGKVYNVVPELVCAEPKGARVHVDAATGDLVATDGK